jgi:hypothetical protein
MKVLLGFLLGTASPDVAWGVVQVLVAAIAGVVSARFVTKPYEARTEQDLARLRSDLEAERDERRALRGRLDFQEEKRFDLLHVERAKVMRETYSALCELEDAEEQFAESFNTVERLPNAREDWESCDAPDLPSEMRFGPTKYSLTETLQAIFRSSTQRILLSTINFSAGCTKGSSLFPASRNRKTSTKSKPTLCGNC